MNCACNRYKTCNECRDAYKENVKRDKRMGGILQEFDRQLRVKIKRGQINELKNLSGEKVVAQIIKWMDKLRDKNTLEIKPLWKLLEETRKEERGRVLVELLDISYGVWNLPDMQDRMRIMRESLRSES